MPEYKNPENPNAYAMCDENGFTQYGMTLRDYFAAKAMQGIISNTELSNLISGNNGMPSPAYVASTSFEIADAMLKQREL